MAEDGGVAVKEEYCGACYHGGPICPTHGKKHVKKIDVTPGSKTKMSIDQVRETPPPATA